MAGGFAGTPEDFQMAFGKVEEAKASMDANLSQLRSNIESTQAAWQGEAAKAFQAVMVSFDEKANKLGQALQNIGELLEQSGHQYAAAEDEQQSTVSGIAGALEGL